MVQMGYKDFYQALIMISMTFFYDKHEFLK